MEAQHLFDAILEKICISLQITKTQFEDAQQKHEAVCKWLSHPASPITIFNPYLYPQGSLRSDTTVRPLGQAEFDVDLVCQLDIRFNVDPAAVYQLIWDRLSDHEVYKKMIERKPRCIRLNYAGQFHMDVVPAVPDASCGGTCIKVPEIPKPTLKDWKPSNPIGYAEWFEKMTMKQPKVIKMAAEAKSYDALCAPKPAHLKRPLRLAVQLFKRWRDITFAGQMDVAPPSIILATLSGIYYLGEQEYADALTGILNQIVAVTKSCRLELRNPVNSAELISERWRDKPDTYDIFVKEVTTFRDRWVALSHTRGVPAITAELEALFGDPAKQAVKEAFSHLDEARAESRLYAAGNGRTLLPAAAAPAVTPAGAAKVRGNVFHGN
jgi:hypothetical protein